MSATDGVEGVWCRLLAVLGAVLVVVGCAQSALIVAELPLMPVGPAPSVRDLVARSESAIASGDTSRALAYLETALRFEPTNSDVLFRAAQLHIDLGSIDQARELLAEGLRYAEDQAAHNVLAFLSMEAGEFGLAAEHFERALALDSGDIYAQAHLGVAYQELGRSRDAIEVLVSARKAHEADESGVPDYLYWYLGLAYFGVERYDDALDALASAEEMNPHNAEIPKLIGRSFETLGDDRAALGAYERSYLLDPTDAEVRVAVESLARKIRKPAGPAPTSDPALSSARATRADRTRAWDGRPVRLLPEYRVEDIRRAVDAGPMRDFDIVVLLNRLEHDASVDGRELVTRTRVVAVVRDGAIWDSKVTSVTYGPSEDALRTHITRAQLPGGDVMDLRASCVVETLADDDASMRWALPPVSGLPAGTVVEYQVTGQRLGVGSASLSDAGMTLDLGVPAVANQYALRLSDERAEDVLWEVVGLDPMSVGHRQDVGSEGTVTHVWDFGTIFPSDDERASAMFRIERRSVDHVAQD